MTSALVAWTRALRVVLLLAMTAVVLVMLAGVVYVVIDESSHGEEWDGFGTFLGALVLVIAAIHLAVLLGSWFVLRSARRAESRLGVGIAGGISLVVSVPWLLISSFSGAADVTLVGVVLAGSAVVIGVGTIAAATQPAQNPRDQPPIDPDWPQPPKSS